MNKNVSLADAAINELEMLLKDPDKKIRLRAISLILRHSHKARRHNFDDEFSRQLDDLIRNLDDKLKLDLPGEDRD